MVTVKRKYGGTVAGKKWVEYSLSELGESMRLILDAMQQWGADYKNIAAKE